MNTKSRDVKEKEREQQLKELRRDLEEKLEDHLPPELLDDKIRVEVEKADLSVPLEPDRAKKIIEALLFASSKPMNTKEIKKVLRNFGVREIEEMILELKREYEEAGRSFEIYEIAGGFEIATRKEFAPWICRAEVQKRAKQATQSALETLAILAYKQPLTRAEIEELRGVDVSGVVANLMEKGFIKIVGKKEIPGRPFLYATTEKFLEHFGLNALGDLPNIEEIKLLVEKSVKREDLLGSKGNVIDVPAERVQPESGASEDIPSAETLNEENHSPSPAVEDEGEVLEEDDTHQLEEEPDATFEEEGSPAHLEANDGDEEDRQDR